MEVFVKTTLQTICHSRTHFLSESCTFHGIGKDAEQYSGLTDYGLVQS
jgi:hypothetical protein